MYSAIAANKRKTIFIMLLFIFIIAVLGVIFSYLYGDLSIFYMCLVGAVIYSAIQYFAGSSLALAMTGARQIKKSDDPRLFRVVENLSISTGMPMPKVYIIDDPGLNAFATGRDPKNASVAVTSGLLAVMNKSELEAVMAHELGHVQNYDIRVMMIVFALVAAIGFIADMLIRFTWFGDRDRNVHPIVLIVGLAAAVIAPFVAFMVQLAVSRRREFLADSTAALTTRYPDALADALQKIHDHGSVLKSQNSSTAHFFFANPLKPGMFAKFFSTHPPVGERIARLRAMSDKL
ncbi:MAG TPA: M48 family metallopeptidase [Candidatus Saccharimonadales bacterium]|nr:M48 family metallopeptidase [Candidatus Saccharimonadales bacterium]